MLSNPVTIGIMREFKNTLTLIDRYKLLIKMGTRLEKIPKRSHKIVLTGFHHTSLFSFEAEKCHYIHFYGNSDSKIIKGLMYILFSHINILPASQIKEDVIISIFDGLDIRNQFDEAQAEGLRLVIEAIHDVIWKEVNIKS